jgi:hypothetical protein
MPEPCLRDTDISDEERNQDHQRDQNGAEDLH